MKRILVPLYIAIIALGVFEIAGASSTLASVVWGDNSHGYVLVSSARMSLNVAMSDMTRLLSGDCCLAGVTSEKEEAFIESLVDRADAGQDYWLGGHQDSESYMDLNGNGEWNVNGDWCPVTGDDLAHDSRAPTKPNDDGPAMRYMFASGTHITRPLHSPFSLVPMNFSKPSLITTRIMIACGRGQT